MLPFYFLPSLMLCIAYSYFSDYLVTNMIKLLIYIYLHIFISLFVCYCVCLSALEHKYKIYNVALGGAAILLFLRHHSDYSDYSD